MKYFNKTTAVITIACTALCSYTVSAESLKTYQNSGIYVDSTTRSISSLNAIGKVDNDTYVLTDDSGLSPKVDINRIRQQQELLDPETPPEPTIIATNTKATPKYTPAEQEFMYFDENDDLVLSKDEFLLLTLSTDSNKIFDYYDANKDSHITISEFEVYYHDQV